MQDEEESYDDDDERALANDAAKKEDKTMLGHKRLKESDKNAEKLGAAAFNHAKKMIKHVDNEEELRDDSEWD